MLEQMAGDGYCRGMSELFPPFEPGDEPKTRRFKPVPLRLLLPNLITLLSMCSGLTGMRLAIEGRLDVAVIAILVAAVLDGLDGRIARMMKGTSRFGAELDSLSDFVSFGVGPAVILYVFVLKELHGLGWIISLLFASASALRLARFNVMIDDPDRPQWQKDFFVGMPAPAGALTALLPVYLTLIDMPLPTGTALLQALYLLFIAFMMISRIPTYAGKTVGTRVPRPMVVPLFILVVGAVAMLAAMPFEMLAAITVIYLLCIPFMVQRYRRLARMDHAQAGSVPPAAA
jgi:CDP-diacylglycerol--serine O-phosphatidyltransferase